MWPLGQYERLVHEVKRRENPNIPITFGLLIADYRQQKCREYILNYIERFNYRSGKYINFYLPGYLEENIGSSDQKISLQQKEFYFNVDIYLDFLSHLEVDFGISYPYTPVLILLEYNKGHFKKAQKIVIELDSDGTEIKQTGKLFEEIFSIAKKYVSVSDISKALIKNEIKIGLLNSIVNGIGNSFLTTVYIKNNEIKKYKLK